VGEAVGPVTCLCSTSPSATAKIDYILANKKMLEPIASTTRGDKGSRGAVLVSLQSRMVTNTAHCCRRSSGPWGGAGHGGWGGAGLRPHYVGCQIASDADTASMSLVVCVAHGHVLNYIYLKQANGDGDEIQDIGCIWYYLQPHIDSLKFWLRMGVGDGIRGICPAPTRRRKAAENRAPDHQPPDCGLPAAWLLMAGDWASTSTSTCDMMHHDIVQSTIYDAFAACDNN
jgi:hypothetical protein